MGSQFGCIVSLRGDCCRCGTFRTLPTANHCQLPPTTKHQAPTAANHHQLPPTASHQPPTANRHQAPNANSYQTWLSYTLSFCKTAIHEHFLFLLRTGRTVRLWDTATRAPPETLEGHSDKVLCGAGFRQRRQDCAAHVACSLIGR